MTLSSWRDWRFPLEFALLLALAFVLPLREAPKNLLWLAYLITWVVNRIAARDIGGRPDLWDGLVAGLLVSGYLSAQFGGIQRGDGNEWLAVNDILRYGLLFFCVRRGGYADAHKLQVLAMLVLSCVLAEFEAILNWKWLGKRTALELLSVGHVNHSAIYMTICLGIAAGLLAATWRELRRPLRVLLGLAILLLLSGLFLGGSRAAGATGLLLLLAATLVGAYVAGIGRRVWLALGALIMVAAVVGGTSALDRQIEWGARNYSLAQRDLIWNRGLAGWREYPVFGLGMENYGHFKEDTLKSWVAAQGRVYVAAEYAGSPHGHSLYVNTLVERGLAGLAGVLALLGAWGWWLLRNRPRSGAPHAVTALWFACGSAWLTTLVIGFANTTLHHEHAMLAMLALALAVNPRATVEQAAKIDLRSRHAAT